MGTNPRPINSPIFNFHKEEYITRDLRVGSKELVPTGLHDGHFAKFVFVLVLRAGLITNKSRIVFLQVGSWVRPASHSWAELVGVVVLLE